MGLGTYNIDLLNLTKILKLYTRKRIETKLSPTVYYLPFKIKDTI